MFDSMAVLVTKSRRICIHNLLGDSQENTKTKITNDQVSEGMARCEDRSNNNKHAAWWCEKVEIETKGRGDERTPLRSIMQRMR